MRHHGELLSYESPEKLSHATLRLMTATDDLRPSEKGREATACHEPSVRAELNRVLSSPRFTVSDRNRRFLEYVVEETLAGRSARIKAYNIATIVFGRPETFDPQLDPVVRMEARRLRRALEMFYLFPDDGPVAVRIVVARGGYVPEFQTVSTDGPVADPAVQSHALPILVQCFDAEGDLSVNNLNRGFARRLILELHRKGECVFEGWVLDHRPSSGGRPENGWIVPDQTLTGNIAVLGNCLSVTALLLDSVSGRVIWGEQFARTIEPGMILTARDEVAQSLATALHGFRLPLVD